MKTILKLLGVCSEIIWGIYPPIPPLFRQHCYSPSVGLSTKMQNKKYHVFSTSETVFRTEIDQKVI